MSDHANFDTEHLPARAAADRREEDERRSEQRRQVEITQDAERRASAERREFLRRVLGERRSDWVAPRNPEATD